MRRKRISCTVIALILFVTMVPTRTATATTLAPGSHVRWIDRIGDLPDFARRFYSWLEENTDLDGALADPRKATLFSGEYIYKLDTIKGSLDVGSTASKQQIQDAVVAEANSAAQKTTDIALEVYGAFDRDHPEVFWLNGLCQCGMSLNYSHNQGTGVVSYELSVNFYLKTADFDIRLDQYRDLSAISAAVAQRDVDIARILADCPKNGTAAEQVRHLNRVLTQSNGYNSAVAAGAKVSDLAWKCISALAGSAGTSGPVCEGYARAFKVLCDRLGIPCVLTEGYARSGNANPQMHMWNYVQLDGKWYAVDVTWNDPVAKGHEQDKLSGYERETYLLIGSGTQVWGTSAFSDTHQVYNHITASGPAYTNGPAISVKAYVFSAPDPDPTPDPEPKPEPEPTPDPIPDPEPDQSVSCVSEYMSVEPYRGQIYSAPQKNGYVFAGWFSDQQLTIPLEKDVTQGEAYAAFVDEDVLGIKCQLSRGANAGSENVDLRLLTGVSQMKPAYVVFTVNGDRVYGATGLFERLDYGDTTAKNLFGDGAGYIATFTIENISGDRFDEMLTVTPGWYTLDGTYVTGAARTLCVSEGLS